MMTDGRETRMKMAVWGILLVILIGGCAGADRIGTGDNLAGLTGRPTSDQMVVSGYLLEQAGFKKMPVYPGYTRSRDALMNNIPIGQITTFEKDGKTYYVYNDATFKTLYMGDDAAYQKYLALAHGQNLCRVTKGPNGEQFWSCMQEYELRKKQGLE
jgi:hypothetical protein